MRCWPREEKTLYLAKVAASSNIATAQNMRSGWVGSSSPPQLCGMCKCGGFLRRASSFEAQKGKQRQTPLDHPGAWRQNEILMSLPLSPNQAT